MATCSSDKSFKSSSALSDGRRGHTAYPRQTESYLLDCPGLRPKFGGDNRDIGTCGNVPQNCFPLLSRVIIGHSVCVMFEVKATRELAGASGLVLRKPPIFLQSDLLGMTKGSIQS